MSEVDVTGRFSIRGYQAKVSYDHEKGIYYGWFTDLKGGADFYADTVDGWLREAEKSLKVYLEECDRRGIAP